MQTRAAPVLSAPVMVMKGIVYISIQFIVEILHLHSTVWRCNCVNISVMFLDKLNVLNQHFVCAYR